MSRKQLNTLLVILCLVIFAIGLSLRFRKLGSIKDLAGKDLPGFVVLEISNVVKAGLWKLDFKPPKTEMVAKNFMNIFSKNAKNRKLYKDPSISPDGRFLLYTLNFKNKKSIAIKDVNGLNEVPFIELDDNDIEKPAFSPDQKHVAMISNNKIYISVFPPKAQREIQNITSSTVSNRYLSWANPTLLGYINTSGIFTVVNIETADEKPLIKADMASFSKDGNLLAISSSDELRIHSVTKGKNNIQVSPKPINSLSYKILSQITWAPDNIHILAFIKTYKFFREIKQLAIINTSTEEIHFLPENWKHSDGHSWSEVIEEMKIPEKEPESTT